MQERKNFIVRGLNTSFICEHCRKSVKPHPSSVRNHCNFCLWSRHVDVLPGDRKQKCGGLMEPIGYNSTRDGYDIYFKCQKCGQKGVNRAAPDDKIEAFLRLN